MHPQIDNLSSIWKNVTDFEEAQLILITSTDKTNTDSRTLLDVPFTLFSPTLRGTDYYSHFISEDKLRHTRTEGIS